MSLLFNEFNFDLAGLKDLYFIYNPKKKNILEKDFDN